MSEFGIKAEELPAMAKEVRESLAPAFECDPTLLTIEDCAEIYRKSFK
jgi:alcohol dehydrogenase